MVRLVGFGLWRWSALPLTTPAFPDPLLRLPRVSRSSGSPSSRRTRSSAAASLLGVAADGANPRCDRSRAHICAPSRRQLQVSPGSPAAGAGPRRARLSRRHAPSGLAARLAHQEVLGSGPVDLSGRMPPHTHTHGIPPVWGVRGFAQGAGMFQCRPDGSRRLAWVAEHGVARQSHGPHWFKTLEGDSGVAVSARCRLRRLRHMPRAGAMPPKSRKRRGAGRGGASKIARRSPVLSHSFGFVADDVAAVVDWPAMRLALDDLTAARLWALDLSYARIVAKLPLKLGADASGARRQSLSDALGVESATAPSDASPEPCPRFVVSSCIELRASAGKGRGWFASSALPAGMLILVERPIVAVLDCEWRDTPWGSCDSADTTALGNELAKVYSPSFRASLSVLHPPEGACFHKACDASGSEDADATDALEEATQRAWAGVDELQEASKERLRAVVRLNSLGFYTNSEQLCHSGNFTALTGSGLFALASGFNHSCEPSVARFSVADVTSFVTNRPVRAGEELLISYIESELLCAPRTLRSQSLNRDFTCACSRCSEDPDGEPVGRRFLNVDAAVQAELSLLAPAERVEAVRAALRGEMGSEEEAEEEVAGPAGPVILGKDAQELRVVEALALMQAKRHSEALAVWRRLAAFSCRHCPPFDEALAAYATQAALCTLAGASGAPSPEAARYVTAAMVAHRAMSGCRRDMYEWRYKTEVELSEVPDAAKRQFWTLVAEGGEAALPTWSRFVESWHFKEEEVPQAWGVGSA